VSENQGSNRLKWSSKTMFVCICGSKSNYAAFNAVNALVR